MKRQSAAAAAVARAGGKTAGSAGTVGGAGAKNNALGKNQKIPTAAQATETGTVIVDPAHSEASDSIVIAVELLNFALTALYALPMSRRFFEKTDQRIKNWGQNGGQMG